MKLLVTQGGLGPIVTLGVGAAGTPATLAGAPIVSGLLTTDNVLINRDGTLQQVPSTDFAGGAGIALNGGSGIDVSNDTVSVVFGTTPGSVADGGALATAATNASTALAQSAAAAASAASAAALAASAVGTAALGNTVPTLVSGKIPSQQLPIGTNAGSVGAGDTLAATTVTANTALTDAESAQISASNAFQLAASAVQNSALGVSVATLVAGKIPQGELPIGTTAGTVAGGDALAAEIVNRAAADSSLLGSIQANSTAIASLSVGQHFIDYWDANLNLPFLQSSVAPPGLAPSYYIVKTAGTTNLNGHAAWNIGDQATWNGSVFGQYVPPASYATPASVTAEQIRAQTAEAANAAAIAAETTRAQGQEAAAIAAASAAQAAANAAIPNNSIGTTVPSLIGGKVPASQLSFGAGANQIASGTDVAAVAASAAAAETDAQSGIALANAVLADVQAMILDDRRTSAALGGSPTSTALRTAAALAMALLYNDPSGLSGAATNFQVNLADILTTQSIPLASCENNPNCNTAGLWASDSSRLDAIKIGVSAASNAANTDFATVMTRATAYAAARKARLSIPKCRDADGKYKWYSVITLPASGGVIWQGEQGCIINRQFVAPGGAGGGIQNSLVNFYPALSNTPSGFVLKGIEFETNGVWCDLFTSQMAQDGASLDKRNFRTGYMGDWSCAVGTGPATWTNGARNTPTPGTGVAAVAVNRLGLFQLDPSRQANVGSDACPILNPTGTAPGGGAWTAYNFTTNAVYVQCPQLINPNNGAANMCRVQSITGTSGAYVLNFVAIAGGNIQRTSVPIQTGLVAARASTVGQHEIYLTSVPTNCKPGMLVTSAAGTALAAGTTLQIAEDVKLVLDRPLAASMAAGDTITLTPNIYLVLMDAQPTFWSGNVVGTVINDTIIENCVFTGCNTGRVISTGGERCYVRFCDLTVCAGQTGDAEYRPFHGDWHMQYCLLVSGDVTFQNCAGAANYNAATGGFTYYSNMPLTCSWDHCVGISIAAESFGTTQIMQNGGTSQQAVQVTTNSAAAAGTNSVSFATPSPLPLVGHSIGGNGQLPLNAVIGSVASAGGTTTITLVQAANTSLAANIGNLGIASGATLYFDALPPMPMNCYSRSTLEFCEMISFGASGIYASFADNWAPNELYIRFCRLNMTCHSHPNANSGANWALQLAGAPNGSSLSKLHIEQLTVLGPQRQACLLYGNWGDVRIFDSVFKAPRVPYTTSGAPNLDLRSGDTLYFLRNTVEANNGPALYIGHQGQLDQIGQSYNGVGGFRIVYEALNSYPTCYDGFAAVTFNYCQNVTTGSHTFLPVTVGAASTAAAYNFVQVAGSPTCGNVTITDEANFAGLGSTTVCPVQFNGANITGASVFGYGQLSISGKIVDGGFPTPCLLTAKEIAQIQATAANSAANGFQRIATLPAAGNTGTILASTAPTINVEISSNAALAAATLVLPAGYQTATSTQTLVVSIADTITALSFSGAATTLANATAIQQGSFLFATWSTFLNQAGTPEGEWIMTVIPPGGSSLTAAQFQAAINTWGATSPVPASGTAGLQGGAVIFGQAA